MTVQIDRWGNSISCVSDKKQSCVHFAVSFKYSTHFFKVTTEELGVVMQRGKRSPFLHKCNDPLEVTNSFGICRYSSLGKYSCLEAEIRLMEETGLFICCRSVSMHSPLCIETHRNTVQKRRTLPSKIIILNWMLHHFILFDFMILSLTSWVFAVYLIIIIVWLVVSFVLFMHCFGCLISFVFVCIASLMPH